MEEILNLVYEVFLKYGYFIVFFGLFLENMLVIGLFFPGETIFLIACFVAARGELNIFYLFILAVFGAVSGNVIGYFLGLKGGKALLDRFRSSKNLTKRLKDSEFFFSSYGGKTVFLARFAAGVRSFMPAIAGASKMNFAIFFWYSITAIILWTSLAAGIGYFFGNNIGYIISVFNQAGTLIFVLFIIFAFLIFRLRRRSDE